MLTELLTRLNHDWLPAPLREPLSAIKAAGSHGATRKVNFLVFEADAARPGVLLKTVRDRQRQELLVKEYETLVSLYRHNELQPGIPQPIGLFEHKDTLVFVEKHLPGMLLENLLHRDGHRSKTRMMRDINLIKSWLINFQRHTKNGTTIFRGADEVLERLKSRPEIRNPLRADLLSLAEEAKGLAIPQTGRHGDFWAGNILISENGAGVIDWETFAPAASPFDDLFFFITTYGKNYFTDAFLRTNSLSKTLAGMAKDVIAAQGIPVRFTPLFFVLFLMDMESGQNQLGRQGGESLPWGDFLLQIESLNSLVMSK